MVLGMEFLGSNLVLWCNLKDEVWKRREEGSSLRAKLRNWESAWVGCSFQLPARTMVRPSLQLAARGFQLAARGLYKGKPAGRRAGRWGGRGRKAGWKKMEGVENFGRGGKR